jgi:hypothetical protein
MSIGTIGQLRVRLPYSPPTHVENARFFELPGISPMPLPMWNETIAAPLSKARPRSVRTLSIKGGNQPLRLVETGRFQGTYYRRRTTGLTLANDGAILWDPLKRPIEHRTPQDGGTGRRTRAWIWGDSQGRESFTPQLLPKRRLRNILEDRPALGGKICFAAPNLIGSPKKNGWVF